MTGRAPILTHAEALELPDPDDCRAPGTNVGVLPGSTRANRPTCKCARHRAIRRAYFRDWRRKNRQSKMADGLGTGWVVGVNALPFGPLAARLRVAGLLPANGRVSAARLRQLDHPFPDEVALLARCNERGWATLHEVDRICVRVLQLHPALVYGQAWHSLETGESL